MIAADEGRLLLRNNQTAHAEFSYRVWADTTPPYTPHPGPHGHAGAPHPTGAPDGYVPPLQFPNLVTLQSAPFSRNDPWLPDGATLPEGNNVRAYADLTAPDDYNAGDLKPTTTAPGVFDRTYLHDLQPDANEEQIAASVTNLFYTTNWLHDWFYDAGFNEAAGNAQHNNFGRGGLGGDAMRAEALDYSGTNNANMATPADGSPPRMQMYRFVNSVPSQATVSAPAALSGTYAAGKASFGPQTYDVVGDVVVAQDQGGGTSFACAAVESNVVGKFALVDRGTCDFTVKARNVQSAGALGMVVVDNAPGGVVGLGGSDPLVTIPAIRLTQADGALWKAQLATNETVTVRLQGFPAEERSSALDNTIIAHEWGHYISNRLIGNANGLTSNHARGLGEGWGDFHALLMMVRPEDINIPSNANWSGAYGGIGGYSLRVGGVVDPLNTTYFGLRRFPYSTDETRNPLKLGHIVEGAALPPTAPINANSASNAEEHNMGEVWASMLWECYVSLLRAHPFQEAQDRMKSYLVASYKLTPVNPTLLEARDALMAAAQAHDPADYLRFAAAFARRGAGVFAEVPDRYSQTNAGVVESYTLGASVVLEDIQLSLSHANAQRCDADSVLDSGETGVLSITVRNRGTSVASDVKLDLSASVPQVTFPDGPVVALPALQAAGNMVVTARVRLSGMVASGAARITVKVQPQPGDPQDYVAQQTLDIPLHRDVRLERLRSDDAEAVPSAMTFGSTVVGQEGAWTIKALTGQDHRYAGSTPEVVGSHWMRTPPLQVASEGYFRVSFRHRYRFEKDGATNYDGGQLMISTDGGTTWASVNATAAGYNGTINGDSGNPAQGQQAYVGQSAGWPAMVDQMVNLGTAYAGQTVQLAWVVHTDSAAFDEGWEVDDIVFTGITNTPFPQIVTDAQTCSAGLVPTDGTPQSARVHTAFGWPLTVTLRTNDGTPVANETVAFGVPSSGASATLDSDTVTTDASGRASVVATANGTVGTYTVTASASSFAATFTLTNLAGPAPTGMTALGGTPQSAQVETAFAQALRVRVLDEDGLPLEGATVTFTAPASGASAVLSAGTVQTNASGEASVTAAANATVGAYTVTASVGGLSVNFALTNVAAPVAGAVNAMGGTPQSAPVNTAFAQPLRVRVLDGSNAPMAGVVVTFAAPASGASVTLSSTTATTNASGEASVSATANAVQGSYTVTATSLGKSAGFALRNTGTAVGSGGAGGGGPLTIAGSSPNGQGAVTVTVQSASTPLDAAAYFSQSQFADESSAAVPAMAGYTFPYGLVGFSLENVGVGNTVTLRIQYPEPVPSGAEYWKYGRLTAGGAPTWHRIPMTLVGGAGSDTIEISLTDGGSGDTDATLDGTITDPGGLRVRAAAGPGGPVAIPALSPWALALLAAGVGLLGWRRRS